MDATVVRVQTASERHAFIELPWAIYRGDPCWVPPLRAEVRKKLDPAVHPFYQHGEIELHLAFRDGRPVGRVAAIVDHRYNEFQQDRTGFFGFFECQDDAEVSAALLGAAAQWLRGKGRDAMLGPANPSTNDECGVLIEGFDRPPAILMPYNPPYYGKLLENFGLAKAQDLYAYHAPSSIQLPAEFARICERLGKRGVRVRQVEMRHFERELDIVLGIYNRAWRQNWGFVPLTEPEIRQLGRDLKPILRPELALVAEADGEPAGFSLCLPDWNEVLARLDGRLFPLGFLKALWYRRKIRTVRLITLGIVPQYKKRGIEALLIEETVRRVRGLGYESGELSWVLESNDLMNRTIQSVGAKLYKRYRMYRKAL